jgi:hypothetical protein
MFGRGRKPPKKRVVHTPECTAIHEAMLTSLYLGYGAPSAPLFIPTGSLVCTCDERREDSSSPPELPPDPTETNLRVVLVAV